MLSRINFMAIAATMLLLQACASQPRLDSQKVANRTEPSLVTESQQQQTFLWGGPILSVQNKSNQTILTVLSYPLSRSEEPKVKKTSGGRFVAIYDGFLEPADYQAGNYVTVLGQLSGFQPGQIADATYHYPVLNVQNLTLRKPTKYDGFRLPISLGLGVGFGF